MARLAEDDAYREREASRGAPARRRGRASPTWLPLSTSCTEDSRDAGVAPAPTAIRSASASGSSPTCTCTRTGRTTARSRPPSSSTYAEAEGLGAIAVTDHNVFGGALEAVELARDRGLVVIPGEEVKTDGQGEVIGLFLT